MQREKRNLLVFGYGMVLILGWIAFKNYRHHGVTAFNIIFAALSVGFLTITLFSEAALKVVYKYWMKVAHFIGGIVTTLILSLSFYIIFGTIGIVLKVLRKDLLSERIEKSATTYWLRRENKPFSKEAYTKQF
jgi:hypothetical protein